MKPTCGESGCTGQVGALWVKPLDGGPAQQLFDRVARYTELAWDRDGGSLVVTRLDAAGLPGPARVHLDGRVFALPIRDVSPTALLRFGLGGGEGQLIVGDEEPRVRPLFSLHRLDVPTGETTELISGAFGLDRWEPPPAGP